MADELFPIFDVPEMDAEEEEEEYDVEYKRSIRWNPELGDFVRDSSNRLAESDGYEAYVIWCYKMLQTERDSHLAYIEKFSGSDLGVEMEAVSQEDDHETVESMIERTITEALEVNPRTEYVGSFIFSWEGDDLHCQFEVKGIHWDETIQIKF
ncbi:MAG: DUF2634 domain-containing protein [Eubacterium sp.]|nr:DUF2634 domain-containing protein [Eubacterium sp.]